VLYDNKFEGTEEFKWIEYEQPINEDYISTPTSSRSKKSKKSSQPMQASSLEMSKVKRLMIPYKFKYFKSDIALEIQALPED